MRTIILANVKGGCGKTTLAHHLAHAAAEQEKRVLAVDTEPQGDLYRRLAKQLHRDVARAPVAWAKGCLCVYSAPPAYTRASWQPPAEPYDLAVVDTAPINDLPQGPAPTVVVIPIDSIDAGLNANDAARNALAAGAKLVVLVRNQIVSAGASYRKNFRDLGDDLPDGVVLCDVDLPYAKSILDTGASCVPAWKGVYKDDGARSIREACMWILKRTWKLP